MRLPCIGNGHSPSHLKSLTFANGDHQKWYKYFLSNDAAASYGCAVDMWINVVYLSIYPPLFWSKNHLN